MCVRERELRNDSKALQSAANRGLGDWKQVRRRGFLSVVKWLNKVLIPHVFIPDIIENLGDPGNFAVTIFRFDIYILRCIAMQDFFPFFTRYIAIVFKVDIQIRASMNVYTCHNHIFVRLSTILVYAWSELLIKPNTFFFNCMSAVRPSPCVQIVTVDIRPEQQFLFQKEFYF